MYVIYYSDWLINNCGFFLISIVHIPISLTDVSSSSVAVPVIPVPDSVSKDVLILEEGQAVLTSPVIGFISHPVIPVTIVTDCARRIIHSVVAGGGLLLKQLSFYSFSETLHLRRLSSRLDRS